jgi:hypothetical protein
MRSMNNKKNRKRTKKPQEVIGVVNAADPGTGAAPVKLDGMAAGIPHVVHPSSPFAGRRTKPHIQG